MQSIDSQPSKPASIFMFVQNDQSTWEYVYHKYAAIMYGVILQMTGDNKVAEEIFKAVFLELHEKKVISQIHTTLCLQLLRYTHQFTLQYLEEKKLPLISDKLLKGNYPLINQLCLEQTDSSISEPAMLQQLRAEFNHLRKLPTQNV